MTVRDSRKSCTFSYDFLYDLLVTRPFVSLPVVETFRAKLCVEGIIPAWSFSHASFRSVCDDVNEIPHPTCGTPARALSRRVARCKRRREVSVTAWARGTAA